VAQTSRRGGAGACRVGAMAMASPMHDLGDQLEGGPMIGTILLSFFAAIVVGAAMLLAGFSGWALLIAVICLGFVASQLWSIEKVQKHL